MTTTTKYSVHYSLIPRQATPDVGTLFAAALDQWHARKRLRVPPLSWGIPASGQLANGTVYRWAPFSDGDEAISDYTLRHPDASEPALSWVTRFSYLAQRDERLTSPYATPVRFTLAVNVALEGPPHLAKTRTTARPAFVGMLDEVFAISDGDLEFRKTARKIPKPNVGDFIQYTLEDPNRRFPIIVLSEHRKSGFLVDPDSIASQYFAVGHVYTLGWREAVALSSEVGSARSVYNGAMRIYFPGFSRSTSPSSHPFISIHRLGDKTFRARLAEAIAQETVAQFANVELENRGLSERRIIAYDAVRARMAEELKSSVPTSELSAYQQLVDAYENETLEVRTQLQMAHARIAELQQKVSALRHALSQARIMGLENEDSAIEALLAEEAPGTALEAVQRAAARTADSLNILSTAYETAEESGYNQPEVILDYLVALADVARRMQQGSLGASLKDAFSEKGIDYAPKMSRTTKATLRKQYRFKDGERTYVCEEHLRRGNDPSLGLRIYFTSESDDGRFVIGHIGRHLETNETN